ncbi:MAG TPA: AAA family ATPase [Nitrososphaeraceae archaeon]|nr:AAA family ATPase [Nitrososphaeraceae archaeon]
MFRNLFKMGVLNISEYKMGPEEKFFKNIIGYSDIKKLLLKSIVSKQPVNILLTGPPSSSKTAFLLEILEGLDDAYYVDAVGVSGAGIIEHLFSNNTKYLLIDEIDKMKKVDQSALLNVMETGILSETKLKGKTRQKRMKLWVFATSNDIENLSEPLRSRFMELHLNEYTSEEFIDIVCSLLEKKFHMNQQLSRMIGDAVWNRMKSKDVRDAINIARLAKSSSDVEWLVDIQAKYSKKG